MFSGNTKATFQAVMADAPNITRSSAWFTVPYRGRVQTWILKKKLYSK